VLENKKSSTCKVLSGVPQGSVLGPLLFLLFINDITNRISSTIRLYVDDLIIYQQIQINDDIIKLQQDLDMLSEWADAWQMKFNFTKCEVSNKR